MTSKPATKRRRCEYRGSAAPGHQASGPLDGKAECPKCGKRVRLTKYADFTRHAVPKPPEPPIPASECDCTSIDTCWTPGCTKWATERDAPASERCEARITPSNLPEVVCLGPVPCPLHPPTVRVPRDLVRRCVEAMANVESVRIFVDTYQGVALARDKASARLDALRSVLSELQALVKEE